jgi:hypothetical protein
MKQDMKFISTTELIDALNRKTRGYGFADIQENEIDAIIARLRAADKLCAMIKQARPIIEIYCVDHLDEYDKAIADFEGKE